eukprot:CAMPEP_0201933448 /NCGR_PEP_ID=MMETSP0903-20130614/31577_1 /ASSEMBLY_ACC=CAM_ASM_000552 /TAXON_ID=420261 /ORGANISM="Thalassiosira antarctica, Strain CCMP982" /LENGTH=433 /DNA_ID=CAMNT_0048473393 /DNA_START=473 /DNA_END=1777 /DNA_ORIENTATION=-
MVRASTQQAVDRIVGTAVIIGLSVVFVRWLSHHTPPSLSLEDKNTQSSRKERYSWMPWWWPVIALQRWSDKSKNEKECKEDKKDQVGNIENNDGDYEHQGSCHCSSITFVLRGPQRLQAVDSPGKIRYPHIPTSANRFQLLRGESDMRFYYEEDNDDSSSITFDHAVEERNDANQASGAHVFCGNCGVHVFHADRSSGELEVNANCLDGGETTLVFREQPSQQGKKWTPLSRSQSSLSSTMEVDNDVEKLAKNSTIETVSETEPFLGSASFLESSDDRKSPIHRKESVSSDPTQSESYSTTMMAESDDLSMASSSITGASMYHSSLSVASGAAPTHDRADRAGLPPLPPSRISSSHRLVPPPRLSSSDRSVKTLPPRFGERPGYASGGVGGGVGSSWSVASMESNDLDGGDVGKTTISPRVRDQMKKYMQKYT